VNRRKVLLLSAAAGLVLALASGALGVWTGVLHPPYPNRKDYPVHGVDVSNHQGTIDWQRVRAAGFEFAYVKASEGRTFTDPEFVTLSEGARQAGLKVGAYHYFTFCSGGAEQADRFLAASGGRTTGDLPPVVDLEFGGNCSRRLTPEEFDREYVAFDQKVTAAFGRAPLLYMPSDFAEVYLNGAQQRGSRLAGRQRWVRKTLGSVSGRCERWTFWQYSARGRVDGIDGLVDLDTYCGSRESFSELTG
jgi:lysozyme